MNKNYGNLSLNYTSGNKISSNKQINSNSNNNNYVNCKPVFSTVKLATTNNLKSYNNLQQASTKTDENKVVVNGSRESLSMLSDHEQQQPIALSTVNSSSLSFKQPCSKKLADTTMASQTLPPNNNNNNNNNLNNNNAISSSVSSSIISSSTSTSGFVSGSNSISNSIASSSKSNYLIANESNHQNSIRKPKATVGDASGVVSSPASKVVSSSAFLNRSINEIKLRSIMKENKMSVNSYIKQTQQNLLKQQQDMSKVVKSTDKVLNFPSSAAATAGYNRRRSENTEQLISMQQQQQQQANRMSVSSNVSAARKKQQQTEASASLKWTRKGASSTNYENYDPYVSSLNASPLAKNYLDLTPDLSDTSSSCSSEFSSSTSGVRRRREEARTMASSLNAKLAAPKLVNKPANNSLINKLQNSVKDKLNRLNQYHHSELNDSTSKYYLSSSVHLLKKSISKEMVQTTTSDEDEQHKLTDKKILRYYKLNSGLVAPLTSPPSLPTTVQSIFLINSSTSNENLVMKTLSNFTHFDIQSTFFNYNLIKTLLASLHTSLNIRTGASAASRQSSFENLNRTMPACSSSTAVASDSRLSIYLKSSTSSSVLCNDQRRYSSSDEDQHQQTTMENSPGCINSTVFSTSNRLDLDDESCASSLSSDLVENCACFRLELGGDAFKGLGLVQDVSQRRMMKLNSISILDRVTCYYKKEIIDLIEANNNEPFTIEYQDWGAYFYRYFFSNQDHYNYVGIDDNIGPVAISIRREKFYAEPLTRSSSNKSYYVGANSNESNEKAYDYVYRIIMRTSDLNTLRGTILEEHIKMKLSMYGSTSKIPHKDILSYILPDLNLNCLRLADSKITDKLIDLDEQYFTRTIFDTLFISPDPDI